MGFVNATYFIGGVAVMILVTYLPRVLPLLFMRRKIKSPYILAFLRFMPYTILTALTIPSIFSATNCIWGALCGFFCAVLLAWCRRPLLFVSIGTAFVTLVVEWLLLVWH